MDEPKQKSSALIWAERELEIVKRELEKRTSDTGYDMACYESALKAYKSLCEDGHSGYSIGQTLRILNRMVKHQPLCPILDVDFPKYGSIMSDCCRGFNEPRMQEESIQCPRMSSLFKSVWEDGKVTYHDNDRVICINSENTDDTFWWGFAVRFVDEIEPITLPYYPGETPWRIYVTQFTVNDMDVCSIDKIEDPKGESRMAPKYFKHLNSTKGFVSISKEEYDELKSKRDFSIESYWATSIMHSIIDNIEENLDADLHIIYKDQWNTDEKYELRGIWWALVRNIRNGNVLDDSMKDLENQCSIFNGSEEARWNTVHNITSIYKPDQDKFVEKHPEFKGLVDTINAVYENVRFHLKQAQCKCIEICNPIFLEKDDEKKKEMIQNAFEEIDPACKKTTAEANAEKEEREKIQDSES